MGGDTAGGDTGRGRKRGRISADGAYRRLRQPARGLGAPARQAGRSLGRGAKSAPRLVSAVLAAPAVGPEGGERDDRGVCRVKAAVGRGRFPRGGREVGRTGCEGPADGARCRACTGRSRGVVRVTTLEREDHRRASALAVRGSFGAGSPRRESLISGGDGCETSLNAHNTVYRVLITVKLYYVVVVFFVYHLSLFPGGGALKFIGRPWSSVARHCTRRHLLTSVSLSFPQCLVLCV